MGKREQVKLIDKELINKIELELIKNKKPDIERIISVSNSITIEKLSFTTKKTSKNPNKVFKTKLANCIGYSAMFCSISNFIIDKYKLSDKIKSEHHIGKLYFLGFDLHNKFENPFFEDHDFNKIVNLENGQVISTDPSALDYLRIKTIKSQE